MVIFTLFMRLVPLGGTNTLWFLECQRNLPCAGPCPASSKSPRCHQPPTPWPEALQGLALAVTPGFGNPEQLIYRDHLKALGKYGCLWLLLVENICAQIYDTVFSSMDGVQANLTHPETS